MRIKQVKQGSRVNGLHLPSREGLTACFCILRLYGDNEATGVFPSCSEHVSFAILLFRLFLFLAGPPSNPPL